MDWKRFYASELAAPAGRQVVLQALQQHADGDMAIVQALRAGGVASFPHVSLRDSAAPLARVAQSVLASGRRHVLALGVLHGGTLPEPQRTAWLQMNSGPLPQALSVFSRFAGAFFARGDAITPFGTVPAGLPLPSCTCIREDPVLLSEEFSLDLFLAVLAAAAQQRGVPVPAVTRLYVGATRRPDGGFEAARALADCITPLLDDDTVLVATGDLAHLGHGYAAPEETAALPGEPAVLQAQVQAGLLALHASALQQRDAAAWAEGTRWRSDQRHILPLLAALLGPGAQYRLLSLDLSDYAAINGQPSPCVVASALGLFTRG